jgi:hypothetical protein
MPELLRTAKCMVLAKITPLLALLVTANAVCAQAPAPAPGNPQTQMNPAAQDPAPVLNSAVDKEVHQTIPAGVRPIAIIPLDRKVTGHAAEVTGALMVNDGRAYVTANASVTSGDEATHVTLPYRGTLLVCASTNVKLAADASSTTNGTQGLMMAMEHGAVELSYAGTTANLQSADVLLTPDFRILIGGPGAADVKVRLGQQGDTCVDNSGVNGPYVVVSSVFDGGVYRVQPGQRVMFQHGSLHEVVDQEKESCGCPPSSQKNNEFPVAQSMGLAPPPKVPPAPAVNSRAQAQAQNVPLLVYQSAEKVPVASIPSQAAPIPINVASAPPAKPKPTAEKKRGFFGKVGHFFRRIFGAEE